MAGCVAQAERVVVPGDKLCCINAILTKQRGKADYDSVDRDPRTGKAKNETMKQQERRRSLCDPDPSGP